MGATMAVPASCSPKRTPCARTPPARAECPGSLTPCFDRRWKNWSVTPWPRHQRQHQNGAARWPKSPTTNAQGRRVPGHCGLLLLCSPRGATADPPGSRGSPVCPSLARAATPLTRLPADLQALLHRPEVVEVPPAAAVGKELASPRERVVGVAKKASPARARHGREVTDITREHGDGGDSTTQLVAPTSGTCDRRQAAEAAAGEAALLAARTVGVIGAGVVAGGEGLQHLSLGADARFGYG